MNSGRLRVLRHGPASGVRNMALDEALMTAARDGRLTLRLYAWDPPCLSLGRHQRARDRYDLDALGALGAQVVRRPTGGRAVYHDREITYAVAAPLEIWGGLRPAYASINRALARGLRSLGVPAEVGSGGGGSVPVGMGGPGSRACFRDPAPGEVTARGRKLVGSALWREGGAILQHGSLLLEDQQALVERLRRPPAEASARLVSGAARPDVSGAAVGGSRRAGSSPPDLGSAGEAGLAPARGSAIGLGELLAGLPPRPRILEALVAGLEEELRVRAVEGEVGTEERAAARRLEAKYRDASWTWRR